VWRAECEPAGGPSVLRVRLLRDGAPVSYGAALRALASDATFRTALLELLRDAPFDGYFWETPPVAAPTRVRRFEFVLVDAPALTALRVTTDQVDA